MTAILVSWGIAFAALLVLAVWLGRFTRPKLKLGILIDDRGRYSLTHFQTVVWTLVLVSLIAGLFFGRLWEGVDDPLGFTIPSEVLGLIGISAGSGVLATAVKSSKDVTAGERIAASGPVDPPFLSQLFLLEEGEYADRAVDIAKFQNFAFTIVLVVAYVALAIDGFKTAEIEATVIPTFSGTFLTLLGISHAAYVGAKVPPRTGTPEGLSVRSRSALRSGAAPPQDFVARNRAA